MLWLMNYSLTLYFQNLYIMKAEMLNIVLLKYSVNFLHKMMCGTYKNFVDGEVRHFKIRSGDM